MSFLAKNVIVRNVQCRKYLTVIRRLSTDVFDAVQKQGRAGNKMWPYVKGTPKTSCCGFNNNMGQALKLHELDCKGHDLLQSERLQSAISSHMNSSVKIDQRIK